MNNLNNENTLDMSKTLSVQQNLMMRNGDPGNGTESNSTTDSVTSPPQNSFRKVSINLLKISHENGTTQITSEKSLVDSTKAAVIYPSDKISEKPFQENSISSPSVEMTSIEKLISISRNSTSKNDGSNTLISKTVTTPSLVDLQTSNLLSKSTITEKFISTIGIPTAKINIPTTTISTTLTIPSTLNFETSDPQTTSILPISTEKLIPTVSLVTSKMDVPSASISTKVATESTLFSQTPSSLSSRSVSSTYLSSASDKQTKIPIKVKSETLSQSTLKMMNLTSINTKSTEMKFSKKNIEKKRETTLKWNQSTSKKPILRNKPERKSTPALSTRMNIVHTFSPELFLPPIYKDSPRGFSISTNATSIVQDASFGATVLVLIIILPFLTLFIIAIVIVLKKKCNKKSNKRKRNKKEDVEMQQKDENQTEPLTNSIINT